MNNTNNFIKHLYVETDSLEFKEAKETGWLRVIIGDSEDVDVRKSQYKGKRRQDFFSSWTLPLNMRDHRIHDEIKRKKYADEVRYIPTHEDTQSRETFEFKVDKEYSQSQMKQVVTSFLDEVVSKLGGVKEVKEFIPTTWQMDAIEYLANSLMKGNMTILLELAARFGKTGTSVAAFVYSTYDVMVVLNYVKTVNRSFSDTVVDFFSDRVVYIDSQEYDFENKVKNSISSGKKV